MSLPRRHPIVEVGDAGAAAGSDQYASGFYSAWRVDGIRDEVSDRGALYPSFAASGANVIMSVYSDRERTQLVAQSAASAIGARVTATPMNSSRLTVSCWVESNAASASVIIWVQLATLADVEEAEDDAAAFFQGTAAIYPFAIVGRACMRQLYLNVQALYPPPQRAGAPLSLYGTGPQVAGKRGLPDRDATSFWSLNSEGDWELVGLQNIADFKEWAIAWSLGFIWKRRAGGSDDQLLERAQGYFEDAVQQWGLLPFLVDCDGDGAPERQVRRSSGLIGRG